MKIGIDARFITHPQPGGFKTYTENLTNYLAKVDSRNQYILYLDRPPYEGCKLPDAPNVTARVVPGILPVVGMAWREQMTLPLQAARDRVDLFHSLCLTAPLTLRCPLVVTIHDMIWAFSEGYSVKRPPASVRRLLMGWYHRLVPRYATSRASAIITVSQAAKASITEMLRTPGDRIFVTHEAANPSFRVINDQKQIEAVRQKYKLPPRYILAIGSADPRKNISTLVQAYALLPQEIRNNWRLVIVWTHSILANELSKQIQSLGLTDRVQFLEQVSMDDLILLYNAASLFVFPSHYEGFGLPPLEAMACGIPVVAADNSSIPEIVGDAALLFRSNDPEGICEKITQVLSDNQVSASLIQKGRDRSAHFSWEKCARETMLIYEKVSSS